ncbi:PEGA domain-containing protein [Bordetella bronchialis]|uniref:PEGA domain-containing protein n=1 Tax=Bordetella bronchialis TaxID=463025 RepID=A0ABM6CVI0_9BORD|nr:PEGA domain-containing protein [Bordetella bronchialis]ANN68147.1 hypothetical protein BAU06_19235 [Bordetella bronchialis]
MTRAFLAFLTITLVGLLAASVANQAFQTLPSQAKAGNDRSAVILTDAEKKLIEVRESTSKWLLALAAGLLPGLVISKTSRDELAMQQQLIPMIAGALLVISIYGFFLSQQAIEFVLSRGPQYHLYSGVSRFPILLQFWTLVLALFLLMIHLFHLARKRGTLPMAALVVLALTDPKADAAMLAPTVAKPCIEAWASNRELPLDPTELGLALSVVTGIAARTNASPANACEFVSSTLDQARYIAVARTGGPDARPEFAELLNAIDKDLRATGISPGAILSKLLSIAAVWEAPSGLLRIEGKPNGATVLLNMQEVGFTNLDLRLAPGKYTVEVLVDGAVVFRQTNVSIEEEKVWKATFGR